MNIGQLIQLHEQKNVACTTVYVRNSLERHDVVERSFGSRCKEPMSLRARLEVKSTKGVPLGRESVTLEILVFRDTRSQKKKGTAVKHAEGMEREIPMPNCSTLRPGCWKTVTGLPCSTTEHSLSPSLGRLVRVPIILHYHGIFEQKPSTVTVASLCPGIVFLRISARPFGKLSGPERQFRGHAQPVRRLDIRLILVPNEVIADLTDQPMVQVLYERWRQRFQLHSNDDNINPQLSTSYQQPNNLYSPFYVRSLANVMEVLSFATNNVTAHKDSNYHTNAQRPTIATRAVLQGTAELPCDIRPPRENDSAILVVWYKSDITPIYSYDMRGKHAEKASHWNDKDHLNDRAFFRTVKEPATLNINHIEERDEGEYRCRVDFAKSPTRNARIHLTVIDLRFDISDGRSGLWSGKNKRDCGPSIRFGIKSEALEIKQRNN
ncbi:hypothetical protein WN48_01529 [Eufriesea mexicana]|nr:hypothetical protein WN48_01529 [Eufriesea mexicana]